MHPVIPVPISFHGSPVLEPQVKQCNYNFSLITIGHAFLSIAIVLSLPAIPNEPLRRLPTHRWGRVAPRRMQLQLCRLVPQVL